MCVSEMKVTVALDKNTDKLSLQTPCFIDPVEGDVAKKQCRMLTTSCIQRKSSSQVLKEVNVNIPYKTLK